MALLLIRRDIDVWKPGQHSGTFRGLNLSFIGARRAIEEYWTDDAFEQGIAERAEIIRAELGKIAEAKPELGLTLRGRGLVLGFESTKDIGWAKRVSAAAFERGLIIECAGPQDETLKFLPPLNIDLNDLNEGLRILTDAINAV